jgi:hypothetical protein
LFLEHSFRKSDATGDLRRAAGWNEKDVDGDGGLT